MSAGRPSPSRIPTVEALTIMSTSCGNRATVATRHAGNARRQASWQARPRARPADRRSTATHTRGRELAADRAARASGAEQDDRAAAQHAPLALRGANESRAVEHVARPRTIRFAAQRIQGADALRRLPESRWQRARTRALYGTVTSNPSRLPSAIKAGTDVVEPVGKHVHGNHHRVHARGREALRVQLRRPNLRDRIADDGVKPRRAVDRRGVIARPSGAPRAIAQRASSESRAASHGCRRTAPSMRAGRFADPSS